MRRPEQKMLDEIIASARLRMRDGAASARESHRTHGGGTSVLLVGGSSSEWEAVARALARELRTTLYRADLSRLVSRYIGETEKDLRLIFDAAEASASVLLFDEADALFGERGEVRDGHDRYANIEVSYLLQRMEAYSGVVLVGTARETLLPDALLGRLWFKIRIPPS